MQYADTFTLQIKPISTYLFNVAMSKHTILPRKKLPLKKCLSCLYAGCNLAGIAHKRWVLNRYLVSR